MKAVKFTAEQNNMKTIAGVDVALVSTHLTDGGVRKVTYTVNGKKYSSQFGGELSRLSSSTWSEGGNIAPLWEMAEREILERVLSCISVVYPFSDSSHVYDHKGLAYLDNDVEKFQDDAEYFLHIADFVADGNYGYHFSRYKFEQILRSKGNRRAQLFHLVITCETGVTDSAKINRFWHKQSAETQSAINAGLDVVIQKGIKMILDIEQ
jgi:hypothetical protein